MTKVRSLVERLRIEHDDLIATVNDGNNGPTIYSEAADEIERLTKEREQADLLAINANVAGVALIKERDHLRDLIRRAVEWRPSFPLEACLADEMAEAISYAHEPEGKD